MMDEYTLACGFQPLRWSDWKPQSWNTPVLIWCPFPSEAKRVSAISPKWWLLVNFDLRALMTDGWFSLLGLVNYSPLSNSSITLGKDYFEDKCKLSVIITANIYLLPIMNHIACYDHIIHIRWFNVFSDDLILLLMIWDPD